MVQVPPRRLPIEAVVKRSFLFAWESRAVLAQPYVIYAVLTIIADLLLSQVLSPDNHVVLYGITAAEQIFAMAFAVGIHRYVLLAELRPGFQFFRWDRHFVQYVLIALLLLILAMTAALMIFGVVGSDPAHATNGMGGATALFGLAVMLVVGLVLSRLALALPLAAIGDQVRTRAVWQATDGNGFRLLATMLLTFLPFLVVEAALIHLLPDPGGGLLEAVITVLLGLISPIQLIVVTIMLSLSYDVLIRGGGPPRG